MKTIIYNAISSDGFIATLDDEADFVTPVEWKSFRAKIKECGNLIVGRRTYEMMRDGGELPDAKECFMVVLSKKGVAGVSVAKSASEAIEIVSKKGYRIALVGGGGKANAAFLSAGLVDEVFLDVEPAILGEGIKLFEGIEKEAKLKLVGTKKLSENEIQLHYTIVKK